MVLTVTGQARVASLSWALAADGLAERLGDHRMRKQCEAPAGGLIWRLVS
jgi:hypothetical protein